MVRKITNWRTGGLAGVQVLHTEFDALGGNDGRLVAPSRAGCNGAVDPRRLFLAPQEHEEPSVSEPAPLVRQILRVLPSFLWGLFRRTYASILSFCEGVIPPLPMFGRSLLQDQSRSVAICCTSSIFSKMYKFNHSCQTARLWHPTHIEPERHAFE